MNWTKPKQQSPKPTSFIRMFGDFNFQHIFFFNEKIGKPSSQSETPWYLYLNRWLAIRWLSWICLRWFFADSIMEWDSSLQNPPFWVIFFFSRNLKRRKSTRYRFRYNPGIWSRNIQQKKHFLFGIPSQVPQQKSPGFFAPNHPNSLWNSDMSFSAFGFWRGLV